MYTQTSNNDPYYYLPFQNNEKNFYYLFTTNMLVDKPDKERTIKEYFNIIYHDGHFLKAIEELMKKYDSYSYDGCYGYYPDLNSIYQNDHFEEGLVRFSIGLDEEYYRVYVSEREFFKYAKEACLRFLELHPNHHLFIMNILDNWKPKYPDKFPE